MQAENSFQLENQIQKILFFNNSQYQGLSTLAKIYRPYRTESSIWQHAQSRRDLRLFAWDVKSLAEK